MEIRKLTNNDINIIDTFLSKSWQYTMVIRSNIRRVGVEYKKQRFGGEYIGAFDNDGILVGVLAHYWNGLLMGCVRNNDILSALIADFKIWCVRDVAFVFGHDETACAIINMLGITNEKYRLNNAEDLYMLSLDDLIMPTDFSDVDVVFPCDISVNTLTNWITAYEIESLGAKDTKEQRAHIQDRVQMILESDNHWVLLDEGVPVSLSGFNAVLPDIVQVGPVWTPPEYRGRGYARSLVALTLEQAKNNGVDKTILFTNNPSAKKAYEAIGYEKIGTYRLSALENSVCIN